MCIYTFMYLFSMLINGVSGCNCKYKKNLLTSWLFFFFCTIFPFVQFYNKLIVGIIHYAYYTGKFEMQWSHSVVWHMAYIEDV